MKPMNMLNNKVAVVTGGTRGIGLAIVKAYLAQGARVVMFGSRQETVDKAVANLKSTDPESPVSGMAPNLSNYTSVEAAINQVVADFGRIDILVNNAGISSKESIYDYKPEDFIRVMDLNVNPIFYASKAAAPHMRAAGGGCIINTSSMVSIYGQPSGSAYPASKSAVSGLTKSLARELGRDNIRVNAVAPGVIRTDMVAALPPEMVERIAAPIPLGRLGEPEEVANVFLFLASDLASYVTGAVVSVDGATQS